jgi:hypothetical protein
MPYVENRSLSKVSIQRFISFMLFTDIGTFNKAMNCVNYFVSLLYYEKMKHFFFACVSYFIVVSI